MRISSHKRVQYFSFAAIAIATLVGLIWLIRSAPEDPVDPQAGAIDQFVSERIANILRTDVVARVGDIEVTEGVVTAALQTNASSAEGADRVQVIKTAVDREIARQLMLEIAERENLFGSEEDGIRLMELNRASCEEDESCRAFVDTLIAQGQHESRDAYWSQSITGYREGIAINNINRLLAVEGGDIRLEVESRLANIQIEWVDQEMAASYLEASQ